MKKFLKKLSVTVFASVFISGVCLPISADTVYPSADKIFDKSGIRKIMFEVNEEKILNSPNIQKKYPKVKGVILVTTDEYKGLIPLGHTAMIYKPDTVVEVTDEGVITGPNDWNRTKKNCYGVKVHDITDAKAEAAADYCYDKLGCPYNFNYLDSANRTKFYCSQLVYAAYMDLYKIDLDTEDFGAAVHPVEIVNSDKTYLIYVK